jgi:hypothetical protein
MRQIECVIGTNKKQLFDGDFAQRFLVVQLQRGVIVLKFVESFLKKIIINENVGISSSLKDGFLMTFNIYF